VALLSGMHHFPPGVPERSWSPRSWSSSSRQSATRASSSRRCTRATAPSSTRRLRLPPPPLRRRARRHTLSGRRAAARSGWIRTARRSWITCQAALQLVGREGLRSEVGERPSAAPHCSSRARPPARAARRRGEAGGSSLRHPCEVAPPWVRREIIDHELHQVWLRPARSNGPLPPLLRECEVFPEGRPRILAQASRGRGRSARTVRLRLPQSRATPWEAVPTRETAQRRSLLRTRPPPSPRSQREASPVPALAPFRVAQRCSSSRRRGGEAERQRLELLRQAGSRI